MICACVGPAVIGASFQDGARRDQLPRSHIGSIGFVSRRCPAARPLPPPCALGAALSASGLATRERIAMVSSLSGNGNPGIVAERADPHPSDHKSADKELGPPHKYASLAETLQESGHGVLIQFFNQRAATNVFTWRPVAQVQVALRTASTKCFSPIAQTWRGCSLTATG